MENGEWDFHHVEGVKHNSLFAKHDEQATSGKMNQLPLCEPNLDFTYKTRT